MIEDPGSLAGTISSWIPVRGPEVVGDLEQGDRRVLEPAVRSYHAVEGGLGGEFVGGAFEAGAGHRRDPRRHLLAKARRGVEPGAHGRPAHRQLQQAAGGVLQLGDGIIKRADVARPLLADGQRSSVLQMRPADLDDLGPPSRVPLQGIPEPPQGGDGLLRRHAVSGDVHRGGERVVAGLAHVHVVVGVDRPLGAERAADQLDAPVGDDLVHVHVGLGP
jgi:hypothetical protein